MERSEDGGDVRCIGHAALKPEVAEQALQLVHQRLPLLHHGMQASLLPVHGRRHGEDVGVHAVDEQLRPHGEIDERELRAASRLGLLARVALWRLTLWE